MRSSKHFAAGAIAFAMLLALQLIATSAIASQMQAVDLLLDTAEGQIICLSEHSEANGSVPMQVGHKAVCDMCAFAAQAGTVPTPQSALLHRFVFRAADMPLPRALPEISERHEPQQTRGPPLNA